MGKGANAAAGGDIRDCRVEDFESADPAMVRCLSLAAAAALTDIPVLILGESGTGKTLLARAMHNSSARAAAPFVSFNAAALSDTLMDSQLFGHEKGAFTGAEKSVRGKFELADRGTLFIDELADMNLAAQAKILRGVEYGEYEKLGSESLKNADVRLLSATHLPLQELMARKLFRKDLFYRLSGITITLPPLRERPNDLRSLVASQILDASRKLEKPVRGLDRKAADLVFSHHWPGNLRELDRVIRAAVSLTPSAIIPADAILLSAEPAPAPAESPGRTNLPPASAHPQTLKAIERKHIRHVLDHTGGNKRQAAKLLGLSRSTLDRKLEAKSSD